MSFSEKVQVSKDYLFEGLRFLYETSVLDRIDRFFINRAPSHTKAYKTRGNVVQRVHGVFTRADYEKLLSSAERGIRLMEAEEKNRK